jgi:hypothetical protein
MPRTNATLDSRPGHRAAYFRDVVLGRAREYRMGSIDQSGSKDVVALISRTPPRLVTAVWPSPSRASGR